MLSAQDALKQTRVTPQKGHEKADPLDYTCLCDLRLHQDAVPPEELARLQYREIDPRKDHTKHQEARPLSLESGDSAKEFS